MALRNVTTDTHALRTPAGFAAAYRTHSRSILIFLARRTYDPETALDLTAETFAQAYAARRRFRGKTEEDAAAWLFGIARHMLARYLRRGGAERRALTRLGVEVPSLEPDDLVRIVELAGLDELRGAPRLSPAGGDGDPLRAQRAGRQRGQRADPGPADRGRARGLGDPREPPLAGRRPRSGHGRGGAVEVRVGLA